MAVRMAKAVWLCVLLLASVISLHGSRIFNGTSQCGVTTKNVPLSGISTITISYWFWRNSGAPEGFNLETSTNSANGSFFISTGAAVCGSPARLFFNVHDASGHSLSYQLAGTDASTNAWHHYVITYPIGGIAKLYIDGADQSLANCGSGQSGNFNNYDLYIGSRNCSTLWLAGKMAQIAIWKVILTTNEIKTLASCREPNSIQPENLVFYSPFYGADSPEGEYSGHSNSVTLTGATAGSGGFPNCPRH